MAYFVFCVCIFRIALPLLVTTCIAFRPSVLSGVYLLFLLYSSIVPVPTEQSMAGHTGIYLKLLIAVSILTALLQFAFHILLLAVPMYREMLENSEFWERLLRYLGFVRLNSADAVTVTTWISPEIIMLLSSIAIYVCCSKLTGRIVTPITTEEGEAKVEKEDTKKKFTFCISLGKYLALASLCFAAVLRPSVQGGFYFLIFLICATWWACYKELQKGFAIAMRVVAFVVLAHIIVLYTYQFDYFQEIIGQNSTYARYFALTPIVSTNETDPRQFHFNQHEWATYVNPLALLWLFFLLIIVSKHLLKPKLQKKQGAFSRLEGSFNGPLNRQMSQRLSDRRIMRSGTTRHRWQSATRKVRVHVNADRDTLNENTPLIRGVSPSRKYGASSKKTATIFQDSTGSVTVTASDDIPMRQLEEEEDIGPTCCDNLLYAMESILLFIIKTSYIATNIIMMTWSITYHSWLTFVLLLWANILWMIPNQRRAMLKSSPFLVFYAWFLLISAYIYSMNLTEAELPSEIKNVNLAQIGFVKYKDLPCNPLLVKCLFTMMFWITLRQYMKERKEAKQNSALADMIAPLQVTVGTAAGINKEEKAENKTLKKLGKFIQKFLTKFWIWIVAITLFTVAITGERMTGFRILYMALFLIFILTFQISFRVWRKIMFGFWLVVIIYSMLVLILVYTYQFDNFKDYWTTYLHVPIEQQLDIGLEKFETPQLFVRLVTPTFFVIIIVVQLHYFHKDFMEITTPREASVNPTSEEDSSVQGRVLDKDKDLSSDKTDNVSDLKLDLTDLANISSNDWKNKFASIWKKIRMAIDLMFLFFEIHTQKFVLFFAMLLCIYDACALHLVIIVFVILGVTSGRKVQMFAILASSVYISILLLAKMVYQIQYIQHDMWNVSCEVDNGTNLTANSAEWLGFNKTAYGRDLPYLVRWNISYILIVTLFCILLVWQDLSRASLGRPPGRVFFMFPHTDYTHASKNLKNCLKYLANYGYYRFGVEVSLIMTVALIGFRMDAYAILYALWLCVLFSMSRSALARIWNVYLIFIAFLLIVQYTMLVGLPPGLCLRFPWDDTSTDTMHRVQNWAYLMSNKYPLSAKKLICDVFLLLFVSRQAVAFRIETRYKGTDYPGGSNESIIHHAEEKNFPNPMPDFITFTRTYLDIAKRVVLLGFMWVTLAIVFLAGANRVNLFSLGYLIGSFMFLWQGGDFYLRPIPKILKAWNWLLGYNVLVIMIKACLQLVGCVFIHEVEKYACWIVQLLAIGCVRKFSDATELQSFKSDCTVPREYVGLAWDGACFAFLLLQRRIFNSYNFFHIIDETKASTILASRGAELIEQLRQKRMHEQDEVERKVLEKIKAKMDRIKATQQKMQGPNYVASTNHFVDHLYPKSRPLYRRSLPEGYKEAIRSGDYYMFDELDDEDLDFFDKHVRSSSHVEDEDEDEELKLRRTSSTKKRTIGELLSTAMKTDLTTTLRGSEDEVKRRASMPLARQRSSVSARSQMSVPFSAPPIIEEGRRREHVEFVDAEPKPGTSKEDQEISELSEPKESRCQKVVNVFLFIWAIIDSTMVSCIKFLNKYSKDYRYVVRVLKKEKKLLKETTDYTIGIRVGQLQMWQPTGSYHTLLHKARAASVLELTPSVGTCSPSDSYRAGILVGRAAEAHNSINSESDEKPPLSDSSENKALMSPAVPCSPEKDRRKASVLTVPEIRILAPSLERGLDSPFPGSTQEYLMEHLDDFDPGELSSYDQPTIFRLVLAIWYIIVSHSDILCYFVIFLNEIKSATFIGLPLVLFVFLWGTLTIPRPSKTFWVTIIAYTQTIVVIKCLFQFEIFEWNVNPTSLSPFYPPRIIGIERKKNYALWDLLLLLIVFFHRYILKSLGLWRTTFIPSYVIPDGEYTVLEETEKKPERRLQVDEPSKTGRSSPNSRRSSDLQRLVEESEDTTEEDNKDMIKVTTTEDSVYKHLPDTIQLTSSKYFQSMKAFFQQLLDPTSRVAADVYSYMFLCDFFNFFVLLIGYSSFGPQQGADSSVSSYLEDNRVPTLFLLMLITQFLLIVIDRAIFLRKNILAKIVFQFLQVVILHAWLFIIYPIVTERQFNAVLAPQMYYMVKCFYLLLSAYQIRCGYPSRILGNFLCKGYGYVNMFLFKGFMLIPFLFELRTVMDWMWTDTSMTVFDWIKMEDIFAHIFQLKCSRHVEDEYPQPRGERKKPIVKYLMGGGLLLIICIIIWFPLIFFSLGNAVGIVNVPSDVTMDIRIGPYEPVYQLSAQANSIYPFRAQDIKDLQRLYNKKRAASAFISNYEHDDIAAIKLSRDSASVWSISPPDRERMIEEVKSPKPLSVRLSYAITHETNSKEDSGVIREEVAVTLEAVVNGKPSVPRENLLKMLEGFNETISPVLLGHLLPKFLKVTSRGTAKPVDQLMDADPDPQSSSLRSLVLILSNSATKSEQEWWEIQENCTDHNYISYLQKLPHADCESILMYSFNDRVFPATLSIITAGGIIGLYTTLVFVASRVLRGFFAEICFKIMFDDMPNVDRVLQLCLDIYLVREAREFSLEEDLFAKAVFLFRSPETLIKWTRPKEEIGDDEDPERDPE